MQLQVAIVLGMALGAVANIYSLSATIPWGAQPPAADDQSTIYNHTYYLSDRTNGLQVVNLTSNKPITAIKGFITTFVNGSITMSSSGPNGVIILQDLNEIWVGDAKGIVRVIDLFTNKIVANISTGSTNRADEFAYDQETRTVVVTNPAETVPYVTVINATSRTVVDQIVFNGASGLEQPAFNPADHKFYISVSSSNDYPDGALATINVAPGNLAIEGYIATPNCLNAGIAFGPASLVFVSCSAAQIATYNITQSYIYNVSSGTLLANVSGVSGNDQAAYSSKTGYFYAAAFKDVPNPILAVIATNGTVVQTIPTDSVLAHSFAVDQENGNLVVPIKAKGILVYTISNNATSGNTSATATAPSIASGTGITSSAVGRLEWNMMALIGAAVGFTLLLV